MIIEAVKLADHNDDVVVRLCEVHNRRNRIRLMFREELMTALECTPLEGESERVAVEGKCFSFEIEPYETKTFRLKVRAPGYEVGWRA